MSVWVCGYDTSAEEYGEITSMGMFRRIIATFCRHESRI